MVLPWVMSSGCGQRQQSSDGFSGVDTKENLLITIVAVDAYYCLETFVVLSIRVLIWPLHEILSIDNMAAVLKGIVTK